MKPISPCLWFEGRAEEAVSFYTSVFKNSRIVSISRYGEAGRDLHGQPAGTVMSIFFELNGQPFMALNGGPYVTFNEAVSFQVNCESQDEVDYYWERLSEGGDEKAQQCGWLKDQFGVSWQVVPTILPDLLQAAGSEPAERVMNALLQMRKIDIATLKRAYEHD